MPSISVTDRTPSEFTIYFGSGSGLYNPDHISFAVFG